MHCRNLLLIFVAGCFATSTGWPNEPTADQLQERLREAKQAKTAADAKYAQVKQQNEGIEAARKIINDHLQTLKTQIKAQEDAVAKAQSTLSGMPPSKVKEVQEKAEQERQLEMAIKAQMPSASFEHEGPDNTSEQLGDKSFKDFTNPKISDLKKQIEEKTSSLSKILEKAGAPGTSRQESIRLTDVEYKNVEAETAELRKKHDEAVEEARKSVQEKMTQWYDKSAEVFHLDRESKIRDASEAIDAGQGKKAQLEAEISTAEKQLSKLTFHPQTNAVAQERTRAQEKVQDLEKRLAQTQAAVSLAESKPAPKPPVIAKAKPPSSQTSADPETKVDDTKPAAPPPAAGSDTVTVPNLSVFDNVSEMKAVLAHAGLVGAFSASGKPPSKDQEFKFSGQSPPADTKVPPGSTVTVSIYQKFEDTAASTGTSADDVTVPDLSVFDNVSEMKAVLAHAGLVGAFTASGTPPSKEKEFKFASQSPSANTKVKPGSTVSVSIYQSFEGGGAGDSIPDVSDMTQEAAQAKLEGAGLTVGGIMEGGKAPSEEKANRAKGTVPAAGQKIPANKVVTLVKWGSFKEKAAPPDAELPAPGGRSRDLVGSWKGTSTQLVGLKPGTTKNVAGLLIQEQNGRIMSNLPTLALQEFIPPNDHDQVVDGNRITYEKKANDWVILIVVQVVDNKLIGFFTYTSGNKVVQKDRWELQRAE